MKSGGNALRVVREKLPKSGDDCKQGGALRVDLGFATLSWSVEIHAKNPALK
jgi:hypothetical protein